MNKPLKKLIAEKLPLRKYKGNMFYTRENVVEIFIKGWQARQGHLDGKLLDYTSKLEVIKVALYNVEHHFEKKGNKQMRNKYNKHFRTLRRILNELENHK